MVRATTQATPRDKKSRRAATEGKSNGKSEARATSQSERSRKTPGSRGKRLRRATPARIERWVQFRIIAIGCLLSLLLAGMAYQAYGLQVGNAEKYRKLARRQHLRMVEVPAPRGAILDARGRELAVTANADSIYVNPREVESVISTAEALHEILDIDLRALEAKLASGRHFAWIDRHVTVEEANAVRTAKLKGVYITQEPRRFYPGRQLAGPVLGFAGIDGEGLDGLELTMDDILAGKRARFAALRDASGRLMMADGVEPSEPGATITLAIDRSIQHIAEVALEKAVTDNQAKAGTMVVLDVFTGEVMAMASWPGYDPNAPGRAVAARARNRAVTDAFEIGSIMKVFTIAAAIDAGVIQPDEVIDVKKGRLRIGRKVIRDTHNDEALSIGDIVKRSSNVGAAIIARLLGKKRLYQALLAYGFGEKTGIELPGERSGRVRHPRNWSEIGLATASFGYGLSVTALQVAAALAAVGNGGVYHEPRVIRRVAADGDVIYQHEVVGRRVMSQEAARSLWPMLHSVFDKGRFRGTAHSLTSRNFDVGGKTGTARKVDPETRQYSTELYVASFAGLAPIGEPRIAVVVVIDEPNGEHYYGGRVAGPAFIEVVDQTLRYLGVPPKPDARAHAKTGGSVVGGSAPGANATRAPAPGASGDTTDFADDEDAPGIDTLDPESLPGDLVQIPDFRGMSVKRALDRARAAGIDVEFEGSGRAVEQIPPPGLAPWPGECRIVFEKITRRGHTAPDPG